ncbi:hypothetical protein D3C73_1113780 [compost metagenome]
MRQPHRASIAPKAIIDRSKPANAQSPLNRVKPRCAWVVNAFTTGISANAAAPMYSCHAHIIRLGQMKAASSEAPHA